jgi:hypothetical protein
MTAVSTKVPAGRSPVGSPIGMPGGGPVPVPRVVGNRRIRTGGIALAVMLLAFGAALSGIALISVSKTSAYLAVKLPVAAGATIVAADLKSVQLSGGSGLTLIAASELKLVVGRQASTNLEPGTLLSPSELTDQTLVGSDQAQIALTIAGNRLPTANLGSGTQINVFSLTGGPTAQQYTITILTVGKPGSDGSVDMFVAVDIADAQTLESLDANGGLGAIYKSAN